MDFENESWKEIKGYGGRYQISNCGRVWNIASGKFKSNRKGYRITVIAKGGDAL